MIGLVLEGGGAKGAYHIGVFRALEELKIQLDGVVGTSIGAINGAMIVQGDGVRAWDIWAQIRNSDLFNIRAEMEQKLKNEGLTRSNLSYVAGKLRRILRRGGIDTSIMMGFLKANIREEDIRRSNMDYGLVTVSLTEMKPVELLKDDIPEGQMLQYIMASASFPGFKPQTVDGKTFVDGGVWNNLPVNLLIDKGYDSIIAVRTNAVGHNRKIDTSYVNLIEIEPSEQLAPILNFDQNLAKRDLNLGYFDTLRIFKGLIGRRYYIEPHPNSTWFLKLLSNIDEKKIIRAGEILGFDRLPPRRMLFERIIPRLATIFGVSDSADYEEMAIEIFEIAAQALDIPRFQIYRFDEFLAEVESRYPNDEQRFQTLVPSFIKTSPHLSRMVRKEILGDILSIFFG